MPGEPGLLLATEISRQNVAKEGYTTYYVDGATGNDGANGLKWESAFLTIQRAIDVAESWAKIYIKSLEDSNLASNAASGQKDVTVDDGTKFWADEVVLIEDDNGREINEVASISGNILTMTDDLLRNYTTAADAKVAGMYGDYGSVAYASVTIPATKYAIQLIGESRDKTLISDGISIDSSSCFITELTNVCRFDFFGYCINSVGHYNIIKNHIAKLAEIRVPVLPGSFALGGHGDKAVIDNVTTIGDFDGGFLLTGNWEIKNCTIEAGLDGINAQDCDGSEIHDNTIKNCTGKGIKFDLDCEHNRVYHNNLINNGTQVADAGNNNKFFENFYDDHTTDTNNDGLCDSPYTFTTGVDYSPVSRRNGWLQQSLGFGAGGVGEYQGDIEIWDSFEYVSDAALQTNWIEGGDAGNPTRSVTAYEGQYSMQTVIGVGTGYIYRLLAARNMKTLANIGIASQSSVGGDTFRFTLYDSSGNYSYWTQTCNAVPNTWTYHNINPHSVPTGASATPVDLEDIVEIRMANLTAASTYKFDFIKFSSLIASKIGIGYDGLDDNKETASSVRGHLLAGLIHGTGTVVPDNSGLYDALLGNISAVNRVAGKTQTLEVSITSAANAGDVTIATVTTQPCVIDEVILHADTAQTTDLISAAIYAGAGKVVTLIDAGTAVQAALDAADKQVSETGLGIRLAVGKTIVISLVGSGATAVDLTATIVYKAVANGGYLT